MIALCVMANNKMPLPLESGVQKDLSWPAMYAIEFTNFRPEIFPDLFARYVFWLSYYAPSQQLKYNLWLDFWNLTWRNKTYAQGAWGGSSSAEFAGVFFLRSGFRSFCTHTSISVRCMMEAWRRRILSEPRLFLFLLWVIFRIRVQRVLLVQQADVVFALFCKIDL